MCVCVNVFVCLLVAVCLIVCLLACMCVCDYLRLFCVCAYTWSGAPPPPPPWSTVQDATPSPFVGGGVWGSLPPEGWLLGFGV